MHLFYNPSSNLYSQSVANSKQAQKIMKELVAEAFLSSFFQTIFERLASTNFTDYFHRGKLDKLVAELESKLDSINQVLDDAEKKQYHVPNVKKWLSDVKHAMYEADQLLDEIATEASLKKLKVESQPTTSNNFFRYVSTLTNPFESRIKKLIQVLDSLAKQKDVLQLENGSCTRNEAGVSSKPSERLPTSYLVDASEIIGRDNEKDEMIKILLSNNGCGNQTPIISILGLGGMGKTTFAKLMYNDNKVDDYFDLKAWVYVSESFDVVGLTKAVLKSFDSSADDEPILNLLQQRLQQRLAGKKYLLVLDDIWNGIEESWDQVLLPFNHGSSGSKIIVTTRDKEVAYVLKATKLFALQQLDKSDCWSLFVTRAFHGKNVCEYPNLESIGKKIVDKCGGLPLAIKTLGQLLRKKFSPHEWMKIFETDMWRLSDGENNINPVRRLSYHNLPSNQKQCFAYCSLFPKGYWFGKLELIQFWMAEGLLKCYGTGKAKEELGYDIFGDLESISFFQQAFSPTYGKVEHYFVMHDLVNDLAKSVSREFCIQIEGARVEGIHERTRHIRCSLKLNRVDKILEPVFELKGLRSLILQSSTVAMTKDVQRDMFSRLKCLRMLSFKFCGLQELVDEISNLKLLRYLDLSFTNLTRLPETVCMLYNLETLLLQCCKLTELPSNFSKLVNLHHLEFPFTYKIPKYIGKLTNLQALPYFIVEEQNGSDINELAELNHLHGTIRIKGLGKVIDPADAETANLKDKKYLEELYMTFNDRRKEMGGSIVESNVSVLEALQPNCNLKRLGIGYYNGSRFPNWLRGCHLPNLVSLKLDSCELCSQFPPLGQLHFLKELYISRCRGIQIIGREFYGNNSAIVPFRSLEVLLIEEMDNWEEWICLEGFHFLKELYIRDCPKLKRSLPQHLPSLQKLVIKCCEVLEPSISKADNIIYLELVGCENIFINELPSSLKRLVIGGNLFNNVTKFSLEQTLLNNVLLEELDLEFSGFIECLSLDLRCYNSLRELSIRRWCFSSLPFSLHLFPNLGSLVLYNCPELQSFHGGGLPSNLRRLDIRNCPKLIVLREKWGLFQLNSLKEFIVGDDFEDVESFPEENLLPPTLDRFTLKECSKLRIMNYKGFLHLKSLQELHIQECQYLECLPEEGLPISLSSLVISKCPLLTHKYQKVTGERWHTIHHIPHVSIDFSFLLNLSPFF